MYTTKLLKKFFTLKLDLQNICNSVKPSIFQNMKGNRIVLPASKEAESPSNSFSSVQSSTHEPTEIELYSLQKCERPTFSND